MKQLMTFAALLMVFSPLAAQQTTEDLLKEIMEEKWRPSSMVLIPNTPGEPFIPLSPAEKEPIISELRGVLSNNEETLLTTATNLEGAETFIALNPTDSNNLVVSYMEAGQNGGLNFPVLYSLDGGDSWTQSNFDPQDLLILDYPGTVLGGGGDPVFAYDDNGKLYFSWIFLVSNPVTGDLFMSMYWAWSDDKGVTFQTSPGSQHFLGRGGFNFGQGGLTDFGDGIYDRQWMGVDRSGGVNHGRLYAAFLYAPNDVTNLAGNGITVRYKDAGVDSFAPLQLPVSVGLQQVQFSNTAIDQQGNVHVSFASMFGQHQVMHGLSSNGSAFNASTVVATAASLDPGGGVIHSRENGAPNMALAPNGDVYITWTDFSGGFAQGYLAVSNDQGGTWSAPLDLQTLNPVGQTQVFMPTVATNQHGTVSLSWFGLNTSNEGHYYTAESYGNLSFLPTQQLSAEMTDFNDFGGNAFLGDYNTSVKSGCKTYSLWADGRNGVTPKVYVGITNNCAIIGVQEVSPINEQLQIDALYPTPFVDEVNLSYTATQKMEIQLKIFGIDGKLIKTGEKIVALPGSNTHRINGLSSLPSGVYMLNLETDLGTYTRQLVRE